MSYITSPVISHPIPYHTLVTLVVIYPLQQCAPYMRVKASFRYQEEANHFGVSLFSTSPNSFWNSFFNSLWHIYSVIESGVCDSDGLIIYCHSRRQPLGSLAKL